MTIKTQILDRPLALGTTSDLPILHYTRPGIMEMEPNIENMTLNEYLEYEAEKERQLWNNARSKRNKKDSSFDEILDDLFRIGAKNLKRLGQEKVQNRCDDDTSRDTNHESGNRLNFHIFHATNKFFSICEQDVDLEEDQEEDDDLIQPLIPKTIHTTPPDKDYVTPTTKSILDDLLEEFRVEILNVTMVDEGA
ncbi:hypothetical protein Tco_0611523 [Tanacetum coccineum]